MWPGLPFDKGGLAISTLRKPPDQDNLVQWLTKMQEDGVTLFDKRDTIDEPKLIGRNVVSFDGTQLIQIDNMGGVKYNDTFLVRGWLYIDPSAPPSPTSQYVFSASYQNFRTIVYLRGKIFYFGHYDADAGDFKGFRCLDAQAPALGVWFHFEWRHEANGALDTFSINGTPGTVGTQTYLDSNGNAGAYLGMGSNGTSWPFFGKMAHMNVGTEKYPLEEGTGLPYDVFTPERQAISMSAEWTVENTTPLPSWNHTEGFRLVPLVTDPTFAEGQTYWEAAPGASWFFDENGANLIDTSGSHYISQTIGTTILGHTYRLTITLQGSGTLITSGAGFFASITLPESAVDYSVDVLCTDTGGILRLVSSSWTGYISSLQVVDLVHMIPALDDDATDLNLYSQAILAAYADPVLDGSITAYGQSPHPDVMDERQVLLDDYGYTMVSEGDLP